VYNTTKPYHKVLSPRPCARRAIAATRPRALKLGVATQREAIHVCAQFQRDTRDDGAVNRVFLPVLKTRRFQASSSGVLKKGSSESA